MFSGRGPRSLSNSYYWLLLDFIGVHSEQGLGKKGSALTSINWHSALCMWSPRPLITLSYRAGERLVSKRTGWCKYKLPRRADYTAMWHPHQGWFLICCKKIIQRPHKHANYYSRLSTPWDAFLLHDLLVCLEIKHSSETRILWLSPVESKICGSNYSPLKPKAFHSYLMTPVLSWVFKKNCKN